MVLQVAVGEHEQVKVPTSGHHLVEGTELLEAQRPLVVVGVGLLRRPTRHLLVGTEFTHFAMVEFYASSEIP